MDRDPIGWRETRRRLARDAERLRRYQLSKFGYRPLTWFLDPAWVCVCLYRLSHLFWRGGRRNLGRLCMQANSLLTGADIQPATDLGGGLLIPSPCGVTLSVKGGRDLTALALSGFGGSVRDRDVGAGIGQPVIGDCVTANQFTGIQGSIRLGDRVVVDFGAGAVVDVADDSRMVLAVEPRIGVAPPPEDRSRRPAPLCAHRGWQETRAAFERDLDRYADEMAQYAPPGSKRPGRLSVFLTNSLLALAVYRLSHWLHLNGHRRLALILCQANILLHKLTLPPSSCIGGGVLMPHLAGTIFRGVAGDNLTLYANSLCMGSGRGPGLGNALIEPDEATPVLGGFVSVGGHSGVFGPVAVGDHVQLGPKVQLDQDVPDDTQAWSTMARGTTRAKAEDPASALEAAGPFPPRALPAGRRWRDTRQRLARDRARLASTAESGREPPWYPALVCVALFRLSHYFHASGFPRLARWVWLINVALTGADISPRSEIGAGLLIPHPAGIALDCRSGEDLTVMATTGIATDLTAEDRLKNLNDSPELGDAVVLSQHSGFYGRVRIGSGVRVAPGCIVTRSTPPGVTLVPRALKFRSPAASGRRPKRILTDPGESER